MSFLPQDENRLRLVLSFAFGFSVLAVYFILAISIAIGHVQKETSYGLDLVLQALGPLGGLFAGWAFGFAQGVKQGER